MFSGMDEYQFAEFFVAIKQQKISQELNIKNLYINMVINIVYKFIIKNKTSILLKFANQYDSLYDEEFFNNIISVLTDAQKCGVSLEHKML